MYLVILGLLGPDTELLDPVCLAEAIEARASAAEQVEHLRVRCRPGGADLVLFLLAADGAAAARAARAVCDRAVRDTPWLARWCLDPPT